jgi:hypothetical protein
MNYAVEMGSDAMIYIPSFIKFYSSIQMLIWVGWGGGIFSDTETARWSYKPPFIF